MAGPDVELVIVDGRPAVREVFGYWPCLIPRELVRPKVDMLEV